MCYPCPDFDTGPLPPACGPGLPRGRPGRRLRVHPVGSSRLDTGNRQFSISVMTRRRLLAIAAAAAAVGLTAQCSIAPLITLAANRVVLAEVFSSAG